MKRTAIVRPIAHIALATAATVTALSASAAGMTFGDYEKAVSSWNAKGCTNDVITKAVVTKAGAIELDFKKDKSGNRSSKIDGGVTKAQLISLVGKKVCTGGEDEY